MPESLITSSGFLDRFNHLRELLTAPEKARFVLHTTVGTIEIGRLSVIGEGQLLVQGRDEATQAMRFLCFAEEQALLFPIEVKDAGTIRKGSKQLGYSSPSMADEE